MFKKLFPMLTAVVMLVGFSTPSFSHASEFSFDEEDVSVDWTSASGSVFIDINNISIDKEQMQMAEELSNYFEQDTDGNVHFTADKETLIEMGISERDAELMSSINSDDLVFREGDQQLQGFVGLRLNLGPKVRAMSAVVAGGFAAGYVGWHVRQIAKAGPWGAAAAGAITASVAGTVGWAVNKGLKRVNVGVNVPFVSLSYTVNIP